jgi:hypothetical protein
VSRRWLVPGLAAAALAVGVENALLLGGSDGSASVAPEAPAGASDPPSAGEALKPLPPVSPEEVARVLAALPAVPGDRSPFEPGSDGGEAHAAAAPAEGPPPLTGVLWSPARRIAFLAGRARTEGESVGEYRLERIEPDRVVLRGRAQVLHVEVRDGGR